MDGMSIGGLAVAGFVRGIMIGTALGLMVGVASEVLAGVAPYEQDFEAPAGYVTDGGEPVSSAS